MAITQSILKTIRVMLGITEGTASFDGQLIPQINTAFMSLSQIGVGPSEGFMITDDTATWDQYLGETFSNLEAAKNYVYLYTRLMFDPPSSSYVLDVMERSLRELEWRLKFKTEPIPAAPVIPEV